MSFQNNKIDLSEIQQQILDTLTLGHETLDKEHESVKSSVTSMLKFMGNTGRFVYNPDNSSKFYDLVADLSSALATVDAVVSDEKIQMFQAQSVLPDRPIKTDTEESKSGLVANIMGTAKKLIRKTDPYESAVPEINKKLNKVERLERFIEMYSHGLETAKIISNLEQNEQDEILDDLLAMHMTIFPNDMGYHIIRIHKSYVELKKNNERESVMKLGVSHQRDLFRQSEEERKFGIS